MLSNQQRNQTMETLIMTHVYFKDDGTLWFVDEHGKEDQILTRAQAQTRNHL